MSSNTRKLSTTKKSTSAESTDKTCRIKILKQKNIHLLGTAFSSDL
jgi:hypothetical protein